MQISSTIQIETYHRHLSLASFSIYVGNDDSDGYLVDFQLKAMDRLSKHNQSKVLGQQQQQDAGLCGSDQIMPMMSVDNMCAFDEHHGSNRQEHFDRHVTAAVASDHDDDTLAGDEEWYVMCFYITLFDMAVFSISVIIIQLCLFNLLMMFCQIKA